MIKIAHTIRIIIVFIGIFLLSCQSDLKFDSEKWKNGGGENITLDIRSRMVNDLINSGVLLNESEIKIAELIGRPEKLHNKNDNKIKYYPVQEKYEWNIDPEEMIFLEILFDEQEFSNSVKLITLK